MITLIKSPLKNSANNIVASPQTRMVKALDFDKKSEYKKFIKWIDSSTKDLEKIKIPSKKEIKKLEKLVLEMDRGGGGLGGLLGLLGGIPGMFLPGLGGPDIPFIRRSKPPRGKPKPNSSKGGGTKIPRLNPKSLGRLNDSFSRYISGKSNFGDRLRLFRRGNIGASGLFTKGGFNAQGALKGQGFKLPGIGGGKPQVGGASPAVKGGGNFLKGKGGGLLSAGLAVYDYGSRVSEGQTQTQAISGAAAGGVGGWAGAALAAKGTAAALSPLIVTPVPGARVVYALAVGASAILGGMAGSSLLSGVADKLTGADKKIDKIKDNEKRDIKNEKEFYSVLKTFNEAVDGLLTFAQGNQSKSQDDESPYYHRLNTNPTQQTPNPLQSVSNSPFINPTPNTNLKTQKGGYSADTGLDIHGNIGDPIVSPVDGTLEYAEEGHSAQANQDSDPTKPGFQPQHSFRIKLDKPFTYQGKTVNFVYGTHLSSLDSSVANKSGIKIKQGQLMGQMGQANNVPHLHLGLVGDRAQTEFLNFKEVDALLGGRFTPDESQRTQVSPASQSTRQVPASQTASGRQQTVIITQGQGGGPQVIPQQIPIPIPIGGGGGGVAVASIPEVVLLNSLWNTLLLTKLSST